MGAQADGRGDEGHQALTRLLDRHLGPVLLFPSLVVFAVLLVYPLGYGIWVSLFNRHLLEQSGTFVGLANYRWLAGNPEFWEALGHSVAWAGATVGFQIVVGTAAALVLHQPFRGRSLARGLVLFPYMMPIISVVLIWMLLYNALYGLLNYVFLEIGLISRPLAWLAHPDTALWSVVLVGTWKYFPFVLVMVLARLQVIPQELYEAARVDGAGAVARFVHVTLPQLRDVLVVVALLRTIWMFNNFEVVFLLTGGGPLRATMTLPIFVYEQAFGLYEVGRGSAVAVVMFAFLVAVMLLYFRLFSREEPA